MEDNIVLAEWDDDTSVVSERREVVPESKYTENTRSMFPERGPVPAKVGGWNQEKTSLIQGGGEEEDKDAARGSGDIVTSADYSIDDDDDMRRNRRDNAGSKVERDSDSDFESSPEPKRLNGSSIFGNIPPSAVSEDVKRSNQEEDNYDNDFSMESAAEDSALNFSADEKIPVIASNNNTSAGGDNYEDEEYEQDDFEFEEDPKSFVVDSKKGYDHADDDMSDSSLSVGHESEVSLSCHQSIYHMYDT